MPIQRLLTSLFIKDSSELPYKNQAQCEKRMILLWKFSKSFFFDKFHDRFDVSLVGQLI